MRKDMKPIFYAITVALSISVVGCGNITVDGLIESEEGVVFLSLFHDTTGVTMTNAAAVGTEIPNSVSRAYGDLSGYSEVRGQFASSLTSTLVQCRIDYSVDGGSNWSTLIPAFSASTVANAASKGSWGTIPSESQTDVLLRAVIVGNGVLDPVIRFVRIELR